MSEKLLLQGAKVNLRPFIREDISDAYIGWFNDPEVTRFNSHGEVLYTREKAEEYIRKIHANKEYLVLAVIAKDSGRHIGNISLQNIHAVNRGAEYAIMIGDKNYWGKGIAKEASRLIIEYGFGALNLHRIYCGTPVLNVPMRRLAESLGFREEGTRREAMYKNGKFLDVVEYGMLIEDFKSKR